MYAIYITLLSDNYIMKVDFNWKRELCCHIYLSNGLIFSMRVQKQ